MPSRNRSANTCELANRSPNETASLTDFSDIPYASRYAGLFLTLRQPLAGLEPLRRQAHRVQRRRGKAADIVAGRSIDGKGPSMGVQKGNEAGLSVCPRQKKEPPLPAARSFNREASNRVDRSHSMSRRWTLIVMIEKA